MTPNTVATKVQLVVVPHTHWDREWYQPFEVFRVKLVRLIDRLVKLFDENPTYAHFMLDGQTIVLEDYLEIRPEMEGKLRELVSSGKVAVGPWYVLPDEFLVSGESIVRNLQIGMGVARRFGRSMELGYLPDSFGHLAQMPQVFQGFGFSSGCLWRGVGDDNPGAEWNWEALDGSRIYLQWLVGGYGNFANLPEDVDAAHTRLKQEVERIAGLAQARTYLLMNGSDHLMPQSFLPGHLEAFRARNPEWDIVHGNLSDAIACAKAQAGELKTVVGELRQAADTSLLPGVLSARTYLKIANVQMQNLLERWVEPFSALASIESREYPQALVRHAWKVLLQNHPHDSICGCSVDAVHTQMMTRFASVAQLGDTLRHEAFAVLQGEDPEAELARQASVRLYNPHPWAGTFPVTAELTLDCPAGEAPVFSLLDEHEQPVSFEILGSSRGVRVVNRSPEYPYNVEVIKLKVRLATELPALGYKTLKIERAASDQPRHRELFVGSNWIENRFFKVRVLQGALEIFDKSAEETIVHYFEDRGDRGDEYNFCPIDDEQALDSRAWHWDGWDIRHGGSSLTLKLKGSWRLPEGLSADRSVRVGHAALDVELQATLHAGVRRVEFETRVVNRSKDHRFRAAFQVPGAIEQTHADTAFGTVTRSSHVPEKPWAEKPMGTFPMASCVWVDRPYEQVGVAAEGLHEYEAVWDALTVTLLRSVGWLSREDLSTRKGDAGPMLESPEAQCLGEHTFRYAWVAASADEPVGTFLRRASEFVVPAMAYPTAAFTGFAEASFLAIDQPAWQMSALKQAQEGGALVLRVFNASPDRKEGTFTFGFPVKKALRARLDETPGEAVTVAGGQLAASLRPFEIATFLLEL